MKYIIPIILTVFCIMAGFENPYFHVPTAIIGFPICLVLIANLAHNFKKAFKVGMIASCIGLSISMYWIAYPVTVFGGLPLWLAIPCPILISAFLSIYYGLYCGLLSVALRKFNPPLVCIFSLLAWASMEYLQSILLTGFPWTPLSAALVSKPFLIQLASIVGAFGLSGVIASLATGIFLVKDSHFAKLWVIILTTLLVGAGLYRNTPEKLTYLSQNGTAAIGIVQGNINQAQKWNKAYQKTTTDKYINLSKKISKKSDIIIWPETAMPFYMQDSSILRANVINFVRNSTTPVLTGAPGYIFNADRSFSLFNRAFLIEPNSNRFKWYDKIHLVPFGEYVPLKGILPLDKLVQGAGDFIPGESEAPLESSNLAMGMLICYEGIFPELAQKRVSKGANILINISNDAWYGNTSAPYQHLALVALRAVEQGRYLVRCTNTGISAAIDPLGKIISPTELFKDTSKIYTVKLFDNNTFYNKNYKILTLGSLTLFFLMLIIVCVKKNEDGLQ